MQSLVSMERTPAEIKESEKPYEHEADKYPYGLSLRLEEETLEKLGITELPAVGTSMALLGLAVVESVGEHESSSGGPHRNLTLQVTELALDPEDTGSKMFPSLDKE